MRLHSSTLGLVAMSVVTACTTVPTRERDAGADAGAMDAMAAADTGATVDDRANPPEDAPTAIDTGIAATDTGVAEDAASVTDTGVCAAGETRCGGNCVNLTRDANNCGACAMVCNAPPNSTATCDAGRCASACRMGFGNCDGNAANGCEATLDTATNCGACGTACSGATPVCDAMMGRCVSGCGGLARCGGSCVDLQTNSANCGACGTVCPTGPNGAPACVAGRCQLSCNTGYGDCDGNLANGCETNVTSSTAHCGRCGTTCAAAANGSPTCVLGTCGFRCLAGFGNCDGNATNGCEANVTNDASNCGVCGNRCPSGANAVGFCASSACGLSCNRDYANCDSNLTNGCEVNTRANMANCGGCGVVCPSTSACISTGCSACRVGEIGCGALCVASATDVNNCGGCGYVCPTAPPGFTATCGSSYCSYGVVGDPRMGDCDRNRTNGYEVNLDTSRANCGACGRACLGTQQCCNGACISSMTICDFI